MNKEYIYVNGKVVIQDETGNKRLEDYNDNLDEILVQENLIEALEKTIKDLEKKDRNLGGVRKRFMPRYLIIFSLIGLPICLFFTNYLIKIAGVVWSKDLYMIPVLLYAFEIFVTLFLTFGEYQSFKMHKRTAKGFEKELEYAKEQLTFAKEKLANLNNIKTSKKENTEFKVVKVNDLEKLKCLKENLEMYFNLGYSNDETKENQLVLKKKK